MKPSYSLVEPCGHEREPQRVYTDCGVGGGDGGGGEDGGGGGDGDKGGGDGGGGEEGGGGVTYSGGHGVYDAGLHSRSSFSFRTRTLA